MEIKTGFLVFVLGLSACASTEKKVDVPAEIVRQEVVATPEVKSPEVETPEVTTIVAEVENPEVPVPKDETAEYVEAVRSSNAFAFDLHKILPATKNIIYSPHSIFTVLAAVHVGARGKTAQQLASALHLGQGPVNYAQYRELAETLTSRETIDGYEGALMLRVTNGLWVQSHYKIEALFQDTLESDFAMNLGKLDFKNDAERSRKTINKSVADATKNKIPELLQPKIIDQLC